MQRITDFEGFSVKKSSRGFFNPFDDSPAESVRELVIEVPPPIATAAEALKNPVPSAPVLEEKAFVALFPQPEEKKETPLTQTPQTPMIQPRSKEGQRLLYKFPDLPTIPAKEPSNPYWLLVGQSDKSAHAWLLQFDGAANPNPGPASSGAVLWSPVGSDGKRSVVFESGKYLGRATNNIAEAQGLLLGLQIAVMRGARELLIEGDSELIIFQHIGKYKVKDQNLKVWWAQTQAAMMDEGAFDWIAIRQVRRELNERADSITKEVLSRREGFQRA